MLSLKESIISSLVLDASPEFHGTHGLLLMMSDK